MVNIKHALLCIFIALGTIFTSSAFAYTPVGVSTAGPGPFTISFAGTNVPCTLTFTITVSAGGTATITGAQWGTNASCNSIAAKNLPWTLGALTGGPTIYSAQVTGVSIYIGALGVTCTQAAGDIVTMTFNNSTGEATLVGTLHRGSIPCGISATGLYTVIRGP